MDRPIVQHASYTFTMIQSCSFKNLKNIRQNFILKAYFWLSYESKQTYSNKKQNNFLNSKLHSWFKTSSNFKLGLIEIAHSWTHLPPWEWLWYKLCHHQKAPHFCKRCLFVLCPTIARVAQPLLLLLLPPKLCNQFPSLSVSRLRTLTLLKI